MQRVRRVDIEGDLIGWLPGALAAVGRAGVKVSDELTTSRSVAVYRTGGPMRDLVTDSPTIGFEVVAPTKTETAALANEISSLVHALESGEVNGHAVQRVVEFAGPAHFPTDDRPTRYTFTFSLDVSADIVG